MPRALAPAEPFLKKFLRIDRLSELYADAKATARGRPVFERLLECLGARYSVAAEDLSRIPRTGPLIAVANHPFGIADGAVLAALLPKVRPDVRIMTNYLLGELVEPTLDELLLWVDPFSGRDSKLANRRPLRQAVEWVRRGGMLAIFPAGEVAHLDLARRRIVDPPWSDTVARLVRLTEASVLPIFFHGVNSVPFHLLGLIHPSLRTARLPHEFLNKRGKEIRVEIGRPLAYRKLARLPDDAGLTDYLYRRTYLLASRAQQRRTGPAWSLPAPLLRPERAVAEPTDRMALRAEVDSLPARRLLAEFGEYAVIQATAAEIPLALREIGRLRELSFRAVGEGSGNPVDLDRFDEYYDHLFVWNRDNGEIVGAYRLGRSDEILLTRGSGGLYTSTLFEFSPDFFRRIGPALELGRSFVRPECQRDFTPLMMLWKGIGAYIARQPRYRVLFGPVSISNEYAAASKQFMVKFLKAHCLAPDLASRVRPRHDFKLRRAKDWELEVTGAFVEDIDALSELVAEIEPDGKGVPVLVRQYLKLGGRLLEFSVDPKFSRVLDGLVVVDLLETDPRILQRYMGKENAARFVGFQGTRPAGLPAALP